MEFRDRIKELVRVRAGDLVPNPKNWRTHPKAQVDAVRAVLTEVGYADALLARELEGGGLGLIDGHLRAETTPDTIVPVLVLDVSEEEADKILVTLDPLAGLAVADSQKLTDLAAAIKFHDASLTTLVQEFAAASNLDKVPIVVPQDQAPEAADAAVTKPGELIVLGNHRLLCGDSSSEADLDRLLDGATIQLVNTDPPYNVNVEQRSRSAIAAGLSSFGDAGTANGTKKLAKLRAKDRPIANDKFDPEEFKQVLRGWFKNLARVLEPGRGFYLWGSYSNCENYPPAIRDAGLYFSQPIIWVKEHPVIGRKDFMGNHEVCYYGWREGASHKFFGPMNATDVWAVKKVNPQQMVHLTEKPVELASRAIQYSSRPGENVLDLFGGSGSTLVACEGTGRHAFLMELDPAYCDVIVARWETLTGKKATREPTEKPTDEPTVVRRTLRVTKSVAGCKKKPTKPAANPKNQKKKAA